MMLEKQPDTSQTDALSQAPVLKPTSFSQPSGVIKGNMSQ
jgi:hypothetical protein